MTPLKSIIFAGTLFLAPALYTTAAAQDTSTPPVTGINLESIDYAYPSQSLELDGTDDAGRPLVMSYQDVAPSAEASGRTIVLLHGKNFTGDYWGETARDLSASGHRVIIPDHIGWGKSSKPMGPFSFLRLGSQTLELLDHLDVEKATVLGHSTGGVLATRMALSFPERVETLILLNPLGLEDYQALTPYRTVEEWEARNLAMTRDKMKSYMRESYYDGKWSEKFDRSLDVFAAPLRSPDYPRLARISALQYDMIYSQPVVQDLDKLEMPTLLLIGTRDRSALNKDLVSDAKREELGRYDRLGKQAAERIPNSKLVEFQGIGHLPHLENYDAFIAALQKYLVEP